MVAAVQACHAKSAGTSSTYVSLGDDNCFQPGPDIAQLYTQRSLGVVECAVKNSPLRLFMVSSEEHSWIDIGLGNRIWSTEEPVVYARENQFGFFPNVGSAPVEIILNPAQKPIGLIFRVTGQDPNSTAQKIGKLSRLFVIGFRKDGACVLGTAKDNRNGRTWLQKEKNCQQQLKSTSLSTE